MKANLSEETSWLSSLEQWWGGENETKPKPVLQISTLPPGTARLKGSNQKQAKKKKKRKKK